MGSTGKYDFQGIQKGGLLAIKAALAATGWGASIIASPFVRVLDWMLKKIINFMANKGLIVLNLGAIYVEGEFDQTEFDKAMDAGLSKIKTRPDMTPEEKKEIDDEVKNAFRKFVKYSS